MSRTIGHTRRNSMSSIRRAYQRETDRSMRLRTRRLLYMIRTGRADSSSVVWPIKNECANWWDYD